MYIIIAGGGAVGYNLTKVLLGQGHEVVLIEMDRTRAQRISEELGSVVIPQRADEGRWLIEAGVERADVVIAATGDDEDNLIICQLAELLALRAGVKKPRSIARVNHPGNESVLKRLGVDATVSPTSMMLALIEEELSAHPAVHLMTLRQAGIELMEFIIPGTSPAVGKTVSDLGLPSGTAVPLLLHAGEAVRPDNSTVLSAEDTVIVLLAIDDEPAVRERLMGAIT
ncbi:MAG TPA: NAD-binding protein [Chloroflexota bacterium]|jgi:trk system potassium uptake protein TrkA|nr:NAD-binding protein [Chloroflexota bacterium]